MPNPGYGRRDCVLLFGMQNVASPMESRHAAIPSVARITASGWPRIPAGVHPSLTRRWFSPRISRSAPDKNTGADCRRLAAGKPARCFKDGWLNVWHTYHLLPSVHVHRSIGAV